MKIVTRYDPPPIPRPEFYWRAIDQDTYDGAEDSPTRYQIGYGRTEEEAIADLRKLLDEAAEAHESAGSCYDPDEIRDTKGRMLPLLGEATETYICPNCGQPEGPEHSC